MNREIKYMAWDKHYKKLEKVTMLLLDTNELDHEGNLNEPKNIDGFELMQYTNLKDKNGTEDTEVIFIDECNKIDLQSVKKLIRSRQLSFRKPYALQQTIIERPEIIITSNKLKDILHLQETCKEELDKINTYNKTLTDAIEDKTNIKEDIISKYNKIP